MAFGSIMRLKVGELDIELAPFSRDDMAWKRWWGVDRPTKAAREAHVRTYVAMQWASENVTLL